MGTTVQGRCTSLVKVMEDDFQMFNACFGKRQKVLERALAATKEGKDLMSGALSLVKGRENMENGAMWGRKSQYDSMAAVTALNL